MIKRIVTFTEAFAVVAFAFWVFMLFANEPSVSDLEVTTEQSLGQEIFAANCASCHGGDGLGGIGPPIAGYNSERAFPDVANQIALVENGRGGMPAFGGELTDEEIASVVDYVRDVLRE